MTECRFLSLTALRAYFSQGIIDALSARCEEVAKYPLTLKAATPDLIRRVDELLRLSGIEAKGIRSLSAEQCRVMSREERLSLRQSLSNVRTAFHCLICRRREVSQLQGSARAIDALCHGAYVAFADLLLEVVGGHLWHKFKRQCVFSEVLECAECGFSAVFRSELVMLATGYSTSPYKEWVELFNSGVYPLALHDGEFVLITG